MWYVAVLLAFVSIALFNVLLNTTVGGHISDGLAMLFVFVRQLAGWLVVSLHKLGILLLRFLASFHWYDVVLVPLLFRFRRLVIVDLPYRFLTNYIAPLFFLDAANRALLRRRLGMMNELIRLHLTSGFAWCERRLHPVFGQYAQIAVWVILSVAVSAAVSLVFSTLYVLAWIPQLERWLVRLGRGLVLLVHPVVGAVTQAVFRMSVLVLVAAWWRRIGDRIVTPERREVIRRRQRAAARAMIRRRRALAERLRGFSWWERFVVWKLGLWQALFDDYIKPRLQARRAAAARRRTKRAKNREQCTTQNEEKH